MSRTWVFLGSGAALAAAITVLFFAPVTSRWTERATIETISPLARAWGGAADQVE